MKTMKRFSTFILATLAFASISVNTAGAQPAPAPAAPAANTAPAGDAALGKADFMKYGCYTCHGTQASGNYFSGIKIAPHPLPFGVISKYIRNPAGDMPSYSTKILPDKDLADIYAYLLSIPVGKAAGDIPLLNATTTKAK